MAVIIEIPFSIQVTTEMEIKSPFHPSPIWMSDSPEFLLHRCNSYNCLWKEKWSNFPSAIGKMDDFAKRNAMALIFFSNRIEESGLNQLETYKVLNEKFGGLWELFR